MISVALRAIHSPENRCFAREGELLWLPAEPSKPLRRGHHQRQPFVGIESGRKSQFGWLLQVEPILEEVFAATYLHSLSDADMDSTLTMLKSIASAQPGTPFAADYMWRILPEQVHGLSVHPVGFHQP